MSKTVVTSTVAANVVREWAKGTDLSKIKGLPENYTVGERGRLHPAIREAYAKSHRGKVYVEKTPKAPKAVKVTAVTTDAKGRKRPVTRSVVVSEARALAQAAGLTVGARGRLPKAVLQSAALGTLSARVAQVQAPADTE